MNEEWNWIPGFKQKYKVSTFRRVKSVSRPGSGGCRPTRMLKPFFWGRYLWVVLWKNNKPFSRKVHRLVLTTFVGPCPPEKEGLHKDDNRRNNFLFNLKWGSHKSNMRQASRNTSWPNQTNRKTVRKIRRIWRKCDGERGLQTKLARRFGLNQSTISLIVRHKTNF
jgi:hypothetical protein